jgi:hypothetical protein
MQFQVIDQNGNPVSFANIVECDVAGNQIDGFGTTADENGYFDIPSGQTGYLSISFLGVQRVISANDSDDTIELILPSNVLNEVVVNGTASTPFDWNLLLTILLILSTVISLLLGGIALFRHFKKRKAKHA